MIRKIAFVQWIDSTSHKKLEKDPDVELDIIENAGILIKETKDFIALGFYWNHTQDHWTETITIPKKCIKKIKRIKVYEIKDD